MEHVFVAIQAIVEWTTVVMVMQYVFLENGLEKNRQVRFNIVSTALLVLVSLVDEEAAVPLIILLGMLNIYLGRDEHQIRGMFLILPIVGIADGLALPILKLPSNMLMLSEEESEYMQLVINIILIAGFLVFLVKGHNWRAKFREDIRNRNLRKWEKLLLSIEGVFMTLMSSFLMTPVRSWSNYLDEMVKQFGETEGIEVAGIEEIGLTTLFANGIFLVVSISVFMMTFITVILIIVGNKQVYYHNRVSGMQFNIITTMADIVENRDENTGGHIKRTAKYVDILAKHLKEAGEFEGELTDKFIEDLKIAAPLHDIGKIHVPDSILNKPGRLTDEEFEIMKTHTTAGKNLLIQAEKNLGKFSYLKVSQQMAGTHHEWWDGSEKGYPDHLSGENIPLSGRIMAVADVFDALTSKRCYKEPLPLKKAYKIITEESGTHFDPRIVSAFLSARDEIELALEEFNEEMNMNAAEAVTT